eukprot:14040823-Ditylum_brightwellii.AAC.1
MDMNGGRTGRQLCQAKQGLLTATEGTGDLGPVTFRALARLSLPYYGGGSRNSRYTLHKASSSSDHRLDYLKFGGQQPTFDVIEKTKEYTSLPAYKSFSLTKIPSGYYSEDYIFKGPIVGPINRKDLDDVNVWFDLETVFPDLDCHPFGFAIDPENPFRVIYSERWKATHTGTFTGNPLFRGLPITGNKCVTPIMPFSVNWNPNGQIIYETLTTAVDRFEGNTKGKVVVFGLLEAA